MGKTDNCAMLQKKEQWGYRFINGKVAFELTYSDGTAIYIREEKTVIFFNENTRVSDELLKEVVSMLPAYSAEEIKPPKEPSAYLMPNIEIILTDKCQLQCSYCYSDASAALSRKTINFERAQKAIDLAFRNAKILTKLSGKPFSANIGFTGGGEPTYETALLLRCLEYINEKSRIMEIHFSCSIQTNGQIAPSYVPRFSELGCNHMNLSMDGIAPVQDMQRKRRDGASSFQKCMQFIEAANRQNITLTVRSTMTKHSFEQFPEFVSYLDKNYPFIRNLYIDTISSTGRGKAIHSERLNTDEMCEAIRRARSLSLTNLIVSHYNMDLSRYSYYCGPADRTSSVYISPNEYITVCPEHATPTCEANDPFIVGHYDNDAPIITDNGWKSRWEQVKKVGQCRCCVALYFCAGGCRTKIAISESGKIKDQESLYWCELTQKLAIIEIHDCVYDERLYPSAQRFTFNDLAQSQGNVSVVRLN